MMPKSGGTMAWLLMILQNPDEPVAWHFALSVGWFALEWSTALLVLSSPCEGQGWWAGQIEGRYGCSLFSGTVWWC